MNKRQEILMRDMTRAIRKIVCAMNECNVDPSGVFNIEVKIPKLDPSGEFVQVVSTFNCVIAEMEEFFSEEEIKFTQQPFDKNGREIPGCVGRIFGKNVVQKMLMEGD